MGDELGLPAGKRERRYLPLHAKTLEDLLSTITDLPLDGVNVTMPYKQAVVEHLDNSDVLTQRTGACNTIVRGKRKAVRI